MEQYFNLALEWLIYSLPVLLGVLVLSAVIVLVKQARFTRIFAVGAYLSFFVGLIIATYYFLLRTQVLPDTYDLIYLLYKHSIAFGITWVLFYILSLCFYRSSQE